jgi:hypothetical protein
LIDSFLAHIPSPGWQDDRDALSTIAEEGPPRNLQQSSRLLPRISARKDAGKELDELEGVLASVRQALDIEPEKARDGSGFDDSRDRVSAVFRTTDEKLRLPRGPDPKDLASRARVIHGHLADKLGTKTLRELLAELRSQGGGGNEIGGRQIDPGLMCLAQQFIVLEEELATSTQICGV